VDEVLERVDNPSLIFELQPEGGGVVDPEIERAGDKRAFVRLTAHELRHG
jgi:hypothetical protein